jgi:DNA-binding MarR family transcriptional regulator
MVTREDAAAAEATRALYHRAGFLVRRINQIANAIWFQECPEPGLTKAQYAAMLLLAGEGDLDQSTLGKRLGLDRTTIGVIVRTLAERGYVRRGLDPRDARRRVLMLSPTGQRMVERLAPVARRAQERLLEPLPPHKRGEFIESLECIADAFNALVSTPVDPG